MFYSDFYFSPFPDGKKNELAFWDWKPWVVKYLVRIVLGDCSLRLKFTVETKAQKKPVGIKWASLNANSGRYSLYVLKHFLGYGANILKEFSVLD